MPKMRIALAQINPTVGDLRGNQAKILRWVEKAEAGGAELVVFPELAVTGYPPKDLVESTRFINANIAIVKEIAARKTKAALVLGFVDRNPEKVGKPLLNAAAFIQRGRMTVRAKTLLPTYDVFDEQRHFASNPKIEPVPFGRHKLGITVCEDIWNDAGFWPNRFYPMDPVARLKRQGADLFINLSSSPFHQGKTRLRLDLVKSHVRRVKRGFVFVNQVGGNDELLFDGNSFALNAQGDLIAKAKSFEEDLVIADFKDERPPLEWQDREDVAEIYDALVMGVRDYVSKCGFRDVLIGLSGGVDSAVTAAIAVQALGPRHVLGVSMPSRYSSEGSVTDSQELAKSLKIELISLPIEGPFQAYLDLLKPSFANHPPDATEENLQARVRGSLLMALSNKLGKLLLTTGNKSELSMGYCTLYGDMNGGLAVIADVPKMMVYALGRYINTLNPVIPESTLTKPPSAELRPNQTDQDSLPPYDVLDAIVEAYVEDNKDVDEITAMGYPQNLVIKILKTIDRNEYKRRQAAPGLRITPKAFGSGRRMPIARGDFRL